MSNILVCFSNDKYKDSAWRLRQQAKKLRFFDKIIHYTMRDLPPYILASPLMSYTRGIGGFIWKPYVIYKTLSGCKEGDVVYYIDSGSCINQSDEWALYDDIIKSHNGIFFQYRADYDYGFSKRWRNNSSKLKHWSKPSELQFFKQYTGNPNAGDDYSLWAGFMILKCCPCTITLVREWLYIFLFHPEIVVAPFGPEADSLPDEFNSKRHDQNSLSYLVMHYRDRFNLMVLPETSESQPVCAVRAQRFIEGKKSWLKTIKFKLYYLLKNR